MDEATMAKNAKLLRDAIKLLSQIGDKVTEAGYEIDDMIAAMAKTLVECAEENEPEDDA